MSALQQRLLKKTDEQLLYYINHPDKHTAEAVSIALKLLKERNVTLADDISETITGQLAEKERNQQTGTSIWNKNIVEDMDAPAYYSQRAIYIFSILFSVLFGAVMLAYNLRKAGQSFWQTIILGILYTALEIYILDQFSVSIVHTFIGNSLGSVVLYQLFWNNWIGKETKYKAKPIWVPLIVALILFIPLLILIVGQTS